MFSKIKSIYFVLLIYFFLNTFSIYNYGLDVGINIVILETLGYLLLFFCLKWGLKKLINLNGGRFFRPSSNAVGFKLSFF